MSSSVPDEKSMELAKNLSWLGGMLSQWGVIQTARMEEGLRLTVAQVSVMYGIRYGVTTPGAIARMAMVTPRAITAVVDKLVAKGLVERREDPVDRRLSRLSLTKEGERVSLAIEEAVLFPLAQRVAALDAGDRAAIERSLELMGLMVSEIVFGPEGAAPTIEEALLRPRLAAETPRR